MNATETSVGLKYDKDKPRLDLIPVRPLEGAGKVFAYGAKKYADRNWEKGIEYSRLYRALIGHLFMWWKREEYDDESGESHLDHAMCCILMLHDMRVIHPEMDNRPEKK